MGMGAAAIGASGGQKAQGPGWQWLQNPEYSQATNTMGNYWDYLNNGLTSLQEGKPPTWFQNWRPLEEAQRKNALTGTYYGRGASAAGGYGSGGASTFQPGILNTQRSADVAAGRRGAGGGSNYALQLANYGQANKDIDNYMSQLGATAMQNQQTQILGTIQGSGNLRGPAGQWGSYEGTPYQSSGLQSTMQGLGALAPYMTAAASNVGTGSNGINQQNGAYAGYMPNSTAQNYGSYMDQWNPGQNFGSNVMYNGQSYGANQ
jgi:hypothetical protein